MIEAKIILDSKNEYNGIRLITSELTYPRFIHAEFMTHRMFSRNAASSRAIPVRRMAKLVRDNSAYPVYWGKNKKGMSADEELTDEAKVSAKTLWELGRDEMLNLATTFDKMGLHKQISNRVIEPWKNITVIVSATEYSNFFALRNHEDAQPEIKALAEEWDYAIKNSEPVKREWHIPYIQPDEEDLPIETKAKIGTARCARVSYLTHDGNRSIDKDLELYQRLINGSDVGHWSPFEHVAKATPMTEWRYDFAKEKNVFDAVWCGNFKGWIQYRKMHKRESL